MPAEKTELGPIYRVTPDEALSRRGRGVAYAWGSEGYPWRANAPWTLAQGDLPDSSSHPAQDYSCLEEALRCSGLMTTDDWPGRYVRTLAQALRQHANVAGSWDWRVVARAVGVVEAAAIAAIAGDDDFEGDGPRIPARERFRKQVQLRPDHLVALLGHADPEARAFGLELTVMVR